MTADKRRQYSAAVHTKLRSIFEAAEQQAHDAIQADDNAQARVVDLEAVIERLRREPDDLRAANRAYARTLADVRAALGAVDDADLAEAARALVAENEGWRKALEQVGEERRAEWIRAERAEADNAELLRFLSVIQASISVDRDVRRHIQAVLDAGVSGAGIRAIVHAAHAWRLAETSWDADENAKAPALLDILRTRIEELEESYHAQSR